MLVNSYFLFSIKILLSMLIPAVYRERWTTSVLFRKKSRKTSATSGGFTVIGNCAIFKNKNDDKFGQSDTQCPLNVLYSLYKGRYSSNSRNLYGGTSSAAATSNSVSSDTALLMLGASTWPINAGLRPSSSANCSCVNPRSLR